MTRCYLHPKSDPTLHAETVEDREKQIVDRFLKSRPIKDNPHLYCEHGCYRGNTKWSNSCCYCNGSEVRCYV